MVLLVGPYSVGKTSFIQYIIGAFNLWNWSFFHVCACVDIFFTSFSPQSVWCVGALGPGRDFPGQRIGPEPTTDRFMAVMHGDNEKTVPGNALTVAPGSPFGGLKFFGNNFLTRFEGSLVPAPVLERLTLVDTPGVRRSTSQKKKCARD
jgi:EH domain-containing protein 1